MEPSLATASIAKHLQSVLPATGREALATSVLPALLDSVAAVAVALRAAHHVALAGGTNAFGDDQLNVDVVAENLVREALARCPTVATASSEEDPVERSVSNVSAVSSAHSSEVYTVGFDPLDGSSIILPNWTVGTIAGVWDGATALGSRPADAQVAAVLGVYGPRTTAIVALRVPGQRQQPLCLGLGYTDASATTPGRWNIVHANVSLASPTPPTTRYFAPANARAAAEDSNYRDLVLHYVTNKYTLRYSGGLVPDLVHMLTKGHGIYLSPVTAASKAKLRRLYELCPVALVLECAGGKAVDPVTGASVLATPLAHTDERGGLLCGTAEEVDKAVEWLGRETT
ncbi:hypothetical protein SCUCBS95973_005679 [Sporothrix curviconia]|uniref:Sedoheptulose-1,7-bisphosphatase n=1 Tax=Sporothrix curviconia TaxID=1260050 RepID=A0ABP0BZS0_9PEZI